MGRNGWMIQWASWDSFDGTHGNKKQYSNGRWASSICFSCFEPMLFFYGVWYTPRRSYQILSTKSFLNPFTRQPRFSVLFLFFSVFSFFRDVHGKGKFASLDTNICGKNFTTPLFSPFSLHSLFFFSNVFYSNEYLSWLIQLILRRYHPLSMK